MNELREGVNVLVTGASGFLASNLLIRLDSMDTFKLTTCSRQPLRVHLNHLQHHYNCSFSELGLEQLKSIDCIIHCAAYGLKASDRNADLCMDVNYKAAFDFIQKASLAGVKLIYSIGSMMEYGRNDNHIPLKPSQPLQPRSAYAESKALLCEKIMTSGLLPSCNLAIRHFRLFFFYGLFEPEHRLYPQVIRAGITNADLPLTVGDQIRDFSPVEHVTARIIHEIWNDVEFLNGEFPSKLIIQNDGSGSFSTVRSFVESVHKTMGFTNRLHFGALPQSSDESSFFVPDLSRDNHLIIPL